MVHLIALLEPTQDADGVFNRRRVDNDRLEPAFQRRVFFDVLAILVERGGTDAAQLAARQRRLEHVARVHGALGSTGADQGVQLVDEQDDLAVRRGDFAQHGLEAVLELAAVLAPRHHRAQVERDNPLVLQRFGHVAAGDALGKPLDDRGFADAGFTDEHRVVLGAPAQHLYDATDLIVSTDDRVELALSGKLG